MAMAKRVRRFRRSRYDMLSVKECGQQLVFTPTNDCSDPEVVTFVLVRPAEIGTIGTANEVNELLPVKGVVFGGLTGDAFVTHNAEDDNPADTAIGFIEIWECIHVQALDEFGFPTYIPRLSDSSIGADRDVDVLWKRHSVLPIWMGGSAVPHQLSATYQDNPDHIRIKSRRRVNEKQAITYSVAIVTQGDAFDDVLAGILIRFSFWFRIAAKVWR